ncbi:hypothetical protein E2C01_039821 [Portunus trituberculatus]|uniref:Uncharacterized protein n=1 Tax=Portunus trituberculatus TaxID=210409 RepID=A0A5B7FHZ6_PORTR|nr:hypothetical protein [Portunus trituberculatus]
MRKTVLFQESAIFSHRQREETDIVVNGKKSHRSKLPSLPQKFLDISVRRNKAKQALEKEISVKV